MSFRSPIPKTMREDMAIEPVRSYCMRALLLDDHVCQGRITWEHVWRYGGSQINKPWAIISLCEYAHDVGNFQDSGDLKKELNEWISINYASNADFQEFPRFDWARRKEYLNAKYGNIKLSTIYPFLIKM